MSVKVIQLEKDWYQVERTAIIKGKRRDIERAQRKPFHQVKWYKVRQLAEILDASYDSVLGWIRVGHLEAQPLPNGSYRIADYAVEEFLEAERRKRVG